MLLQKPFKLISITWYVKTVFLEKCFHTVQMKKCFLPKFRTSTKMIMCHYCFRIVNNWPV